MSILQQEKKQVKQNLPTWYKLKKIRYFSITSEASHKKSVYKQLKYGKSFAWSRRQNLRDDRKQDKSLFESYFLFILIVANKILTKLFSILKDSLRGRIILEWSEFKEELAVLIAV